MLVVVPEQDCARAVPPLAGPDARLVRALFALHVHGAPQLHEHAALRWFACVLQLLPVAAWPPRLHAA